jgi:hypothetical protein
LYRLGLVTGYLRWQTRRPDQESDPDGWTLDLKALHPLPSPEKVRAVLGEEGLARLLVEADEVVAGRFRLFGGPPRRLELAPQGPLVHWTDYELGRASWGAEDVKLIWEPARFGWACTLARAYHLSRAERFVRAFWSQTETFLDANPPYLGPHWVSAQEVALRLVALMYAARVFASAPESTPTRLDRLGRALVIHAERIPPTLHYARAQNNNHLLTEAVGLFTAGVALPDHPRARAWRESGWRWLNRALQTQIAADGTYIQHSTNYHRLMLQAALWAAALAGAGGRSLAPATRRRLVAAVHWALQRLDRETGRTPNLGPNDGAYFLPLTVCPFHDHRPVLNASARAFLGERIFSAGPWQEMALWFLPQVKDRERRPPEPESTWNAPVASPGNDCVLRPAGRDSWGYLRAATYTSRPGHADQLHFDLWWRGLNVAMDAGTYLYNASPPWENALAVTAVHNTVTVDGTDQMTPAGRFLWLDWAQASVVQRQAGSTDEGVAATAQHDGYRRLGVIHRRSVTALRDSRWEVWDRLTLCDGGKGSRAFAVRLHWLLPDWPWEIDGSALMVRSPHGWVILRVTPGDEGTVGVSLARAGERLFGQGRIAPAWGWVSPTYAHKVPALSFAVDVTRPMPIQLRSEWVFP